MEYCFCCLSPLHTAVAASLSLAVFSVCYQHKLTAYNNVFLCLRLRPTWFDKIHQPKMSSRPDIHLQGKRVEKWISTSIKCSFLKHLCIEEIQFLKIKLPLNFAFFYSKKIPQLIFGRILLKESWYILFYKITCYDFDRWHFKVQFSLALNHHTMRVS